MSALPIPTTTAALLRYIHPFHDATPPSGPALKMVGTETPKHLPPSPDAVVAKKPRILFLFADPGRAIDNAENRLLMNEAELRTDIGGISFRAAEQFAVLTSEEGGLDLIDLITGNTLNQADMLNLIVVNRAGADDWCASVREVCEAFSTLGAVVVNANLDATSKSEIARVARRNGLPHPKTLSLRSAGTMTYKAARSILGSRSLVLKKDRATEGDGAGLVHSCRGYQAYAKQWGDCPVVVQVPQELATSVRIVTINGRAICGVELTSTTGDWRSNAALGATGRQVQVTPTMASLATKLAGYAGLHLAGVDLVRSVNTDASGGSNGGWTTLEANPGFAWVFTQKLCGDDVNIAKSIIDGAVHMRHRRLRGSHKAA